MICVEPKLERHATLMVTPMASRPEMPAIWLVAYLSAIKKSPLHYSSLEVYATVDSEVRWKRSMFFSNVTNVKAEHNTFNIRNSVYPHFLLILRLLVLNW